MSYESETLEVPEWVLAAEPAPEEFKITIDPALNLKELRRLKSLLVDQLRLQRMQLGTQPARRGFVVFPLTQEDRVREEAKYKFYHAQFHAVVKRISEGAKP